jgi:hypothetical protein
MGRQREELAGMTHGVRWSKKNLSTSDTRTSVANWQKFRLQNTQKMAEKWPTFLKCDIHIKATIIGRNILFIAIINSAFLLLFWAEVFEN